MEYSKNYTFREVEQQRGEQMAGNEVGKESGTTFFESIHKHLSLSTHHVSDTENTRTKIQSSLSINL